MWKRRLILTVLTACTLVPMVRPADAGFFDRLFGSFVRRVEPPTVSAPPSDMSPLQGSRVSPQGMEGEWRPRSESGPRSAYCVRTCDGHYFPVQAHAGMSAAQMCSAFCPAAQTKLYSGGGIDYAAASDGSRYRDLPKAFVYRKQMVDGCTCNGKDAFGLARIELKDDPTLARGDIVATKTGLATVVGRDANGPQLAATDARRVSPREPNRSAEVRVIRNGRSGGVTYSRVPRETETTGAGPAED